MRASNIPTYTAIIPRTTLPPEYAAACHSCWVRRRVKVSLQNVEKVVKPPQNPTVRKSFQLSDMPVPRSTMPQKTPISKQPKRFTAIVPIGKTARKVPCKSFGRSHRETDPKAPPMAIQKIDCNISSAKIHIFMLLLHKKREEISFYSGNLSQQTTQQENNIYL